MLKYISIILLSVTTINPAIAKMKQIDLSKIKTVGIASHYGYASGSRYKRKPRTASGSVFNPMLLTAAHKYLPFGTRLRVTNMHNNKSVIVTVNDRGPFVKGRILDLTTHAAKTIGISGIQKVSMQILNPCCI